MNCGGGSASCARRLFFLVLEVLRFGTGMLVLSLLFSPRGRKERRHEWRVIDATSYRGKPPSADRHASRRSGIRIRSSRRRSAGRARGNPRRRVAGWAEPAARSEEQTSELQSPYVISYA